MILATHGIVGGAIGYLIPQNPLLSFFLGFLSHFVLDAIPHWHYPVFSAKIDKENPMNNDMDLNRWFVVDLFDIGIDFLAGLAISVLVFHPEIFLDISMLSILGGAVGAVIPDPLQFIYWKMPNRYLALLQRFHMWIHSSADIDKKHFLGITTQVIFAGAVIWLAKQI